MQPKIEIFPGDNRDSLRQLIAQGVRVHSVVTDPPYNLDSITKRFGKKGAAPARTDNNDGSFARLSSGFVGKTWDATGIENDPEFWSLVLEILLPGGFCFAFSGARTGHRQASAMEAAGFIMHPMHVWAYAKGFPKAKDVARELRKSSSGDPDAEALAEQWEGWKFGTQAQKPAIEPIYLAQKPLSEKTYVANIREHGVGAVNIDGCRVPLDPVADEKMVSEGSAGRYPSNLFHDKSEVVTALFDERKKGRTESELTGGEDVLTKNSDKGYGMSAARFFHGFMSECEAVIYHPKADKGDRGGSTHPTVKPVGLIRNLIKHVTPPGGVVLDPFAGSGTTGVAAQAEGMNCILMEAEDEYVEFLHERFSGSINAQTPRGSGKFVTDLSDLLGQSSENTLLV